MRSFATLCVSVNVFVFFNHKFGIRNRIYPAWNCGKWVGRRLHSAMVIYWNFGLVIVYVFVRHSLCCCRKTNANNWLHRTESTNSISLYTKNRKNQFDNNFSTAILRVLIICKFSFFSVCAYIEREYDSATFVVTADAAFRFSYSFSVKSAVVGVLHDYIAERSLFWLPCRLIFVVFIQNSVIILCMWIVVCVCVSAAVYRAHADESQQHQ